MDTATGDGPAPGAGGMSGDPKDETPEGAPGEGGEPRSDSQGTSQETQKDTPQDTPQDTSDEAPSQTITCPGCGSVYDRRYLTECCRYEAGQGYRCANCNHFLEREAQGE